MIGGKFQIYGVDLADLEDKQKKRERERDKLLSKSAPLRRLNKQRIDDLTKECEAIGYKVMSAREEVRANPVSEEMYRKERVHRDAKAEAEKNLKQKKTVSSNQKIPTITKEEFQENQKRNEGKVAEIMEYLANRKKDKQAEAGLMTPVEKIKTKDNKAQLEDEYEPK